MELEQLACDGMAPVDFEHTLFQALVNEGKHIRVSEERFAHSNSSRTIHPIFFLHGWIFRLVPLCRF